MRITQNAVQALFGDGLLIPKDRGRTNDLVWSLLVRDDSLSTRCAIESLDWDDLTTDEQKQYRDRGQFMAARSRATVRLRQRLASVRLLLDDIRSLEIPQRSYTLDETADLFRMDRARFSTLAREPKGDKALVKAILDQHMPKSPPMLVDILLNAPYTLSEALDLLGVCWNRWSSERRQFVLTWGQSELDREYKHTRAAWSRHKRAILDDLGIPDAPRRVRRVLRWPDVWAWRGLVCGQGLHENFRSDFTLRELVAWRQSEFNEVSERIAAHLTNLSNRI